MDNRLFFPATQRNKEPIRTVLEEYLPKQGTVLEIASGSGEHGIAFQKAFPKMIWQSSDKDESHVESISDWIKYEDLNEKMPKPIKLDVQSTPWELNPDIRNNLCAIVCINLIHISPWNCCEKLFEQAGLLLKRNHPLILYGPFKEKGEHTSISNYLFDKNLINENPAWGVRDLEQIKRLAINNGLEKFKKIQMPANNLSCIFNKL